MPPVIGKRKREEYNPQQLQLARKVKNILVRVLKKKIQNTMSTVHLNPSSRRTSNINDFSASLLQEFSEIDSPFYKLSYSALPEIFDICLDGYSNSSTFNTDKERKAFLNKMSAALYEKFKNRATDDEVLANINL